MIDVGLASNGGLVGRAHGMRGESRVDRATLWQPGAAYLDDLELETSAGGSAADTFSLPVDIRAVEVVGAQFLMNG